MPNPHALPAGLCSRPPRPADLATAVGLLNASAREATGAPAFREGALRGLWSSPGFDLAADARLVETADGLPVGFEQVLVGPPYVQGQVLGAVRPGYRGRGIGSHLLGFALERGRARLRRGARTTLLCHGASGDDATAALLRDHGFAVVRRFCTLTLALDSPPGPPRWPAGVEVRPFDRAVHDRAVCAVFRETFADHWGHVERSLDDEYALWRARLDGDDQLDTGLWWVAWAGEEIAGVCLCWPHAREDSSLGWVSILGVRRPWRRRGLGLALLKASFCGFFGRGVSGVGLEVDAESPTGALRLYRRAGMEVRREHRFWERELPQAAGR